VNDGGTGLCLQQGHAAGECFGEYFVAAYQFLFGQRVQQIAATFVTGEAVMDGMCRLTLDL
jgi:hypothetical protein